MLYFNCLVISVLSCLFCSCDSRTSHNVSYEPSTKDKIVTDSAVVSTFKKIRCRLNNSHALIWDFKPKGDSKWQSFPNVKRTLPSLSDRNRTIQILSIGWDNDGTYRCRAINAEHQIIAEHSTYLNVYSCTDRKNPEIFPPKIQYGYVGSMTAFTCTGDFGCTPDSLTEISWYSIAHGTSWNKLPDKKNFPRYNVTIVKRNKDTIIESKLVLTDINQDDFSRNFACYITSQKGNESFPVHLREINTSITRGLSKEQVSVISITCVVVMVVVLVVTGTFYSNIKLFIFSYLPICGLEDIGDYKYHAFILHDVDDRDLADLIRDRLEKDSYVISMSGHISADDDERNSEHNMIEKTAKQCRSLIIIYPTNVPMVPENDIFSMFCGAQQYFRTKLITIVVHREQRIHKGHILNDNALRKLEFPDNKSCYSYRMNKFCCKLKLRLPNPKPNRSKSPPVQAV